MRKGLLLLFLLIGSFSGHANSIDSLNTKSQVSAFLIEKFKDEFKYEGLFADRTDSGEEILWWEYMSDSFYKADIDGNGSIDLVVDGHDCFAVLDIGGKYVVHYFDREHRRRFSFKGFIELPNRASLLMLNKDSCFSCPDLPRHVDTLVYNFEGFIEYNKQFAKAPEIEKITFSTSACFGWCPVYNIEIRRNGDAMFEAKSYNDTLGTLFATIGNDKLGQLFKLLGYMNVGTLRNAYRVGWTDDQAGYLKIVYSNGDVKEISDYGLMGTFGLQRLYEMLNTFRKSELWKQWYELPPEKNSYMLDFEQSFEHTLKWDRRMQSPFDWQAYTLKPAKRPNDTMRFTMKHPGISLNLNPDSSFVFIYKPLPTEERRIYSREISFGKWRRENDSVISLNWNGALTLSKTRDGEIRKRYFHEDKIPMPVRIENWRFQLSADKKRLLPFYQ